MVLLDKLLPKLKDRDSRVLIFSQVRSPPPPPPPPFPCLFSSSVYISPAPLIHVDIFLYFGH